MQTRNTCLALAAVMVLSTGAFAQQAQKEQKRQQRGQMSMDDMMKQCREHCQATSTSVDQTLATIRDAKQSNDPAKMRAALDTVEKPLAGMQEHMKMCIHMMDMMQMHGGMGGMMGGRTGGMMSGQKQPATSSADEKSALDITFKSQPDPPKTGENTFEVTVKGPDGKPITDADVSVRFYMAAMQSMPEMRNTVTLKHVADGRYRATGNVTMGGRWDVTVVVTKGGKEIGSRKLAITAK